MMVEDPCVPDLKSGMTTFVNWHKQRNLTTQKGEILVLQYVYL